MSFDQSFLAQDASRYVNDLHKPPFEEMLVIEKEALDEGQPAVGRSTGALLRTLVASTGARRVLEVGTNLGYSALWIAAGLPRDGILETIELDATLAMRAQAHARSAGVGSLVRVHVGAALDVLPRLSGPFDLVFIDAVKAEYPKYLDHAVRLLRPGGVVAADNAFWLGRAWDEKADDEDTRAVRAYTRRVTTERGFVTSLVPSEDGLLVSVVQKSG